MPRRVYRALPQLKQSLQEIDESLRGRMATVVESNGHLVRVRLPEESSEGGAGWYPSTRRHLPAGQVGVLLPGRGTNHYFLPIDIPNAAQRTLNDNTDLIYWLSGRYFGVTNFVGNSTQGSSVALAANATYSGPFRSPMDVTVDAMSVNVMTAATGASALLAIYESSPTTGFAIDPPLATGTVAADTTGIKVGTLTEAPSLKRNTIYWLAICPSEAISVSRVTPTRNVLPTTTHSDIGRSGVLRSGSSFSLSVPDQSFTTSIADIQVRRA